MYSFGKVVEVDLFVGLLSFLLWERKFVKLELSDILFIFLLVVVCL